jgi:uncharacterized protein YxeA
MKYLILFISFLFLIGCSSNEYRYACLDTMDYLVRNEEYNSSMYREDTDAFNKKQEEYKIKVCQELNEKHYKRFNNIGKSLQ